MGGIVTENSVIKSKIKTRLTAGNICYRAFIKLVKSIVVTRLTKQTILWKILDL